MSPPCHEIYKKINSVKAYVMSFSLMKIYRYTDNTTIVPWLHLEGFAVPILLGRSWTLALSINW